MLVFERYPGQSIMIGDDIEITIAFVRHGRVRIGITAPRSIPVHRKEIYERRHRQTPASGRNQT